MNQIPMRTPPCDSCLDRYKGKRNLKSALAHHAIWRARHRIVVTREGGNGWPGFHDECDQHTVQLVEQLERQGKKKNVDFGIDFGFWERLEIEREATLKRRRSSESRRAQPELWKEGS